MNVNVHVRDRKMTNAPAGHPLLTIWLACTLVIVLFAPGLVTLASTAGGIPEPLRQFLQKDMALTRNEMQSIVLDRAVAKLLETQTNDEIAIFGIIKIRVPQEFFIEKFRDIIAFESGQNVRAAGIFHSPPELSDVTTLQINDEDMREIRNCKPGDCEVKMSDRAMKTLIDGIDWTSPGAKLQAQLLIRQELVDYLAGYQQIGDNALSVYSDKEKPQAIRENLGKLLQNSSHFFQYDPILANYLKSYPQGRPVDTEDIFYWQNGEFGLKPVIRASHLVIHRSTRGTDVTYTLASKMLIATHYFRAALELKTLVPESSSPDGKSFFLLCLNRSFVDGLTGFKAAFIRGTVKKRSRESLERYLLSSKKKIESAYQSQYAAPR